MKLSTLIQKGGLVPVATAIPATSATKERGSGGTVATIATVAVANPSGPETEGTAPDLPEPWARIRDLTAAGWRAEFSAPAPDGTQRITWIPPDAWTPTAHHQGEPAPLRSPTGGTKAPSIASGPVACGDCRHFEPDTIGDGSGIGSCGAGAPLSGPPRYPRVERYCRRFERAG